MSSIILDPSAPLVKEPYDKFWDSPPTRRELRIVMGKLGMNDSELMGMVDTLNLVVNYLCEKSSVTREELEAYVEQKKAEMQSLRDAAVAQVGTAPEAVNEQSNG